MRIETVEQALVREVAGRPALWLLHGFGESGLSLQPLFATPLANRFGLFVPDLPGFGASPPLPGECSLDRLAAAVASLIDRHTPDGPLGLVGHSLGAAVAVRAARRLERRVGALLSIEGNLTEADAYFSGRAALFDAPDAFKARHDEAVWRLAQGDATLRRYFASLAFADAGALWQLGRDAARASRGDGLGAEYRALLCPTLYCWSGASTPEATQHYLRTHRIAEHRYEGAGHWPTVETPAEIAAVLGDFFQQHLPPAPPLPAAPPARPGARLLPPKPGPPKPRPPGPRPPKQRLPRPRPPGLRPQGRAPQVTPPRSHAPRAAPPKATHPGRGPAQPPRGEGAAPLAPAAFR